MADRPILFSGPMVRALLDGRKTMTRRVLNPQPTSHVWRHGWSVKDGATWSDDSSTGRIPFWAGDRLWVREAWRTTVKYDATKPRDLPAGMTADNIEYLATDENELTGRNRPGMFMPRWASRITLIVTDVTVERLQDISPDDAAEEGVRCDMSPRTFVDHFRILWERINGPGSWGANPFVAAYTFKVEQRNIDAAREPEQGLTVTGGADAGH